MKLILKTPFFSGYSWYHYWEFDLMEDKRNCTTDFTLFKQKSGDNSTIKEENSD